MTHPVHPIARPRGVESLLNAEAHLRYAAQLEQKDIWFAHCGGQDVFTHMGLELVRDATFAPMVDLPLLRRQLTGAFAERRFLSKAPTNTFRMRLIAALFPGAKFVVLYRDGEEVVGSWGRRPYGFGRRVTWGEMRTWRLGYKRGIDVFARKWEETLLYAESCRDQVVMTRLTYRQLVGDPAGTLARLTAFLELESPLRIPPGMSQDRDAAWRDVIPPWWRPYLRSRTVRGHALLRAVEAETSSPHLSSSTTL